MEENSPPERCVAKGDLWRLTSYFSYLEETSFAVVMCASRYGIYMECLAEIPTCLVHCPVRPIARRRQLALW